MTLTISQVRKEVKKIEGAPASEAGITLLSAAVVGARQKPLVDYTGLAGQTVAAYLRRGKANGIFTKDGKLAAEWADGGEGSGVAFCCDVATLEGWIKRVPARKKRTDHGTAEREEA